MNRDLMIDGPWKKVTNDPLNMAIFGIYVRFLGCRFLGNDSHTIHGESRGHEM